MTQKFWFRTVRNLAFRRRPYFAHLAFTHRCNLRCRFCHIPEERVPEQDTEGMKKIIDRLDRLGIAVLSISGGGEPLLRSDFATLLNYAASKGLYTKITSNGTMPRARYQELLASGISEIAISLDGVAGNDLPYSHTGPKILETLRFLNDNLPPPKLLTINITISSSNRDQVDEMVSYCTREFPKARIWLNPVVVGEGKLRVPTQLKVNPAYLRRVSSPTLLTPGFFKQACEDYYQDETYNWGCLAGEFFFDIKPDGSLWICQDHPPAEPLNILDPEFEGKYRRADFSHRRQCGGCTYSCYYVTQNAFQPRFWPGMAGIWWKTTTQPEEPCRKTAEEHGWLAGLLHFSAARSLLAAQGLIRASLWAGLFTALALGGRALLGQSSLPPLDPQQAVVRMEKCNAQRAEFLQSYRSRRRYAAANPRLHREAQELVEVKFDPTTGKEFRVLERSGSPAVASHVLAPAREAERLTTLSPAREASEISTRNYSFEYVGYDAESQAFIFQVEPRTRNKYLLRGKIWITADDFAIRRIEGEPAQRHSFWIRQTHFVQEYAKFGGFWFPVSNRAVAELRWFGRSTMNIDYFDYGWQPGETAACAAPVPLLQSAATNEPVP